MESFDTSYQVAVIASAIGIIPIVGWFWFLTRNKKLNVSKVNLLIKVFFWGVLTAIPISLLEIFNIELRGDSQIAQFVRDFGIFPSALVIYIPFIVVAVIEEVTKGIGILLSMFSKKVRTINDGMAYGMIVGLAFGVTENGVYFASSIQSESSGSFITTVVLRFILSTSAHVVYSGIVGNYLAEAVLIRGLHRKIIRVGVAVIVPVAIHAVFNFLLTTEYSWLVVTLISTGFLVLWLKYNKNDKIAELAIKTRKEAAGGASVQSQKQDQAQAQNLSQAPKKNVQKNEEQQASEMTDEDEKKKLSSPFLQGEIEGGDQSKPVQIAEQVDVQVSKLAQSQSQNQLQPQAQNQVDNQGNSDLLSGEIRKPKEIRKEIGKEKADPGGEIDINQMSSQIPLRPKEDEDV